MSTQRINLGDRVRDIYTGFEGIAIARTQWLHGCDRIIIEPTTLKDDGSLGEAETFDEQRVELVRPEPVRVSKDSDTERKGGPRPDAVRHRATPSRRRVP